MRHRNSHTGTIIRKTLLGLLTLFLLTVILLQTAPVQSALASMATSRLTRNLPGDIRIGKIQIQPFSTVVIKDLLLLDTNPPEPSAELLEQMGRDSLERVDTILRLDYLVVRLGLSFQGLEISQVKVRGLNFNLVNEDAETNLARALGLTAAPLPWKMRKILSCTSAGPA